jgi:deazaflavin-dependent oxidoreductase (nitroreductase family)
MVSLSLRPRVGRRARRLLAAQWQAMLDLHDHAGDDVCRLTTTGRRSGRAHEIEIWFVVWGSRLYVMAGGGHEADWVRNLVADPRVVLRLGDDDVSATGSLVDDPGHEERVRRLMAAKYQGWQPGQPLSAWAQTALVVAVDPQTD